MWLEIGLVVLGIVALVSTVNFVLRKLLKIEKEKKDFLRSIMPMSATEKSTNG